MSLRARLAAWLDRTFWPGLDDRQPCPSVAEVVARMTPPAPPPPHVPPVPDDYRTRSREHAAATTPGRPTGA